MYSIYSWLETPIYAIMNRGGKRMTFSRTTMK